MARLAAVVAIALAGALSPAGARAVDKKTCLAAAEEGQGLRAQGKLLDARARFYLCAQDDCPRVVRVDCVQWAGEVDASIPTIVLHATEGGRDLADVEVSIDGTMLLDALAGRAIPVDPGPHRIIFAHRGLTATEELVIDQGQKNRRVDATFEPAVSRAATEPPASAGASTRPGIPVSAWILGGAAITGFANFTYFGLTGRADLRGLRSTCAPGCTDDQLAPVRRELAVADVSLGVGLVALGIAAYLVISNLD